MTCIASRNYAVRVLSLDDELLEGGVYPALLRREEACAYLHALRTEHERRRHTSAVSDTARRDDGYLERVYYLRNEAHRRILADMTARFCALRDYRVSTRTLHSLSESHRRNNGNDLDIRLFPCGDVLARVACTRSHHAHALVDAELSEVVRIGAHKHYIHAERLICLFLALAYLVTEVVYRSASARDETDTARIRHCGGESVLGYPSHTALYNGIFTA